MTQLVKQITTTQRNVVEPTSVTEVQVEASSSQTVENLVYFLFGILDVLLAFRMIFKLLGANATSLFVNSLYKVSGIFVWPFENIFSRGFTQGIETTSVFEPSTLIAIFVYALLAWGIVKLVQLLSKEQ